MAKVVKNLPANAGDTGDMGFVLRLGKSSRERNATQSNILAWEIRGKEEPGRLQSTGSPKKSDTTEHTHILHS